MFDKLLRELKKLERGVRVPVQIPLDDDGYMDRRCPAEVCLAAFKVLFEDWRDKVRDEAVYCPICRHEAAATEWNTPGQQEHLKRLAVAHVGKVVGNALRDDARGFNQRQPHGGLITMSMSYRPGPSPILVPPEAAAIMTQRAACESCGCRYSSVGAAFFCPGCGHNSAATTFAAAVQTVRTSVQALPGVSQAVEQAAGRDAAADAARQILENGLVKLVASFQRLAEAAFQNLPNASSFTVRRNAFQNLTESSRLWREATGKGYDDLLPAAEMGELARFFQQRHLLAHKEGLVDQEYLDRSGDLTYAAGQRLVVREEAVLRLADLVERLVGEVQRLTPSSSTGGGT